MTTTAILTVLAAIALIAAVRQVVHSRRRGDARWRVGVLVAGQFVLAVLLVPFLSPPLRPSGDASLVVLTADAPRPPAGAGADHVALPEAPAFAGIARVPDLGTALRRAPQTRSVRVVGAGLPARDRDVARDLRVVFEPAALPAGIVALDAPVRVAAGRRFDVAGRVEGAADARLELLDPAGVRVDLQPVDRDGRFALSAIAGPAGRVDWTLRRRDAADAVVETVPLPVEVVAGAPLRVLLLSGGANPEHKYLARWALDAGFAVRSRASLGGGVDVGAATPPLTVDGLRDVDLVILDDRFWRTLGDGGRAALRDAVRDGVGVLVRLTADPSAADRAALKAWGFAVDTADVARDVELPGTLQADPVAGADATGARAGADADAPTGAAVAATDDAGDAGGAAVDADADARAPVTLSRRALALSAADGVPLLRDADGAELALWRAEGRGRIGVWNVADTFRLQLAGRRAAYGSLWAAATGALARPRDDATMPPPTGARVGERLVLCGIGTGATLAAPDGAPVALTVDPATGADACAAAWPTVAGWHALRDGERTTTFPVRARDDAPGLARAALRDATLALAAQAVTPDAPGSGRRQPGPRWPWLLAWLAAAAALWAFERRRG